MTAMLTQTQIRDLAPAKTVDARGAACPCRGSIMGAWRT